MSYVVLDLNPLEWGSNDDPSVVLGYYHMKWRAEECVLKAREKIEAVKPNCKFFKVRHGYDYEGRQLRIFELPKMR